MRKRPFERSMAGGPALRDLSVLGGCRLKHRWKLLLAAAAAAALTVFFVCFYTPKEVCLTVPVCSLSGETAELSLDVVWRRRLFSPNRLTGRASLFGQTYYSRGGYERPDGTLKIYGSDTGFFEGLGQKFSGNRLYPFSLLSEPGGTFPFQIEHELILSEISGESFRRFQLACTDVPAADGSGMTVFFGPAETAAEAEAIWAAIQGD